MGAAKPPSAARERGDTVRRETADGGLERMEPPAYSLWIESLSRQFDVQSFRGREALSRPYCYEVVLLTSRVVSPHESSLVGRAATFTIRSGEAVRRVRGVIASQQSEGHARDYDRHRLRVKLVPRLWVLRRRRASRIYQDRTVQEIVSDVLARAGVRHRWETEGRYPALEYCVQYRETDFDFVARLLAEHGIFYDFDHPAEALGDLEAQLPQDAHTLADAAGLTLGGEALDVGGARGDSLDEAVVFCDHARAYAPAAFAPAQGEPSPDAGAAAPILRFTAEVSPQAPDEDAVTEFEYRNTVRSNEAEVRGFDFLQPLAKLTARATVRDRGELPRGVTEAVSAEHLEDYAHHDEYNRPGVHRRAAGLALERHQSRVLQGRGESHARRLAPGRRFALDGHPLPELNQEYVVTRVEHDGYASELAPTVSPERPVYRNRFECVPAEVTWRPRRLAQGLQQTLETATVVGPPGEEIYTDDHGRIKVRFHWDREGVGAETSCWVRVSQPWSGPSMGTQWIPRVGHEVLVAFLEGDADRPIVIGSAYNGAHGTPFGVPGDRTRSGLRTSSSPGGGGHNELSFQDAAGHEEVFLRAERDLNVIVRHDVDNTVTHDVSTFIGGQRRETIQGSSGLTPTASLDVTGEYHVTVSRRMVISVGPTRITVDRASVEIDAPERILLKVGATSATLLPAHAIVASEAITLSGDGGHALLALTGDADLHGQNRVRIHQGENVIDLATDMLLSGPAVSVYANGAINARGATVQVDGADSTTVGGGGASTTYSQGHVRQNR